MIPARDTSDFKNKFEAPAQLLKYGFGSLEEYNSFRYSDYCFKKFMEAAEQENYFHNTIFVLLAIMAWPEMLKLFIHLHGPNNG